MLLDRGAQCKLTATIWLSSIPSIRIVILHVLLWTLNIELPSLNYYSLGRWLLLWKAGYASSIGGGWNQCWSIHYYVIHSPFSISITIINGLIHRTKCHRVSPAIRIGLPIRLPVGSNMYCPNNMPSVKRSNMYQSTNMSFLNAAICIDRLICQRWRAAICIGQPICHPESAAICHQVQYDLQYILWDWLKSFTYFLVV